MSKDKPERHVYSTLKVVGGQETELSQLQEERQRGIAQVGSGQNIQSNLDLRLTQMWVLAKQTGCPNAGRN